MMKIMIGKMNMSAFIGPICCCGFIVIIMYDCTKVVIAAMTGRI